MLNLGTGGLSEKLWECPLIYISHTLRTLRIIWEHIKNAYSWFQPPGDAECMNMELGPVTCVFYNLPRWISATTSLSLSTCMHWRRKWQPIPVFLPEEAQGRGSWWAAVYGVAQSRTQLQDRPAAAGGVLKQGATDNLGWLRCPCSTGLLLPIPTPDPSASPASSEL